MEKLELKHLAPYLPYGLKMYYDVLMGHTWVLDKTNLNAITDKDKPILRPLSDLTKNIESNKFLNSFSSNIVHKVFKLVEYENSNLYEYILKKTPYGIIGKLFEHHFDVFGLIEKGLAIDINTLKK